MAKVFDVEAALERCDGDRELYLELFGIFNADYVKSVGSIEAAMQSHDLEKASQAAHAIKSALGNLGAMVAFQLAAELEKAGKAGNAQPLPDLLTQLKTALDEYRQQVTVWSNLP